MQTNHVESEEQVAGLESVVPALERLDVVLAGREADQSAEIDKVIVDLARLGERIESERDRKMAVLKNFACDSHDLAKLKKLYEEGIAQLDIFNVLGVAHSELHHSKFLAWLLNPRETHGVGDYFLKSFLHKTCVKAESARLPCMTPSRIDTVDWSGTEVLLERDRIDVRVLNREARFVCAIENKIWSPEGIGEDGVSQLHGYRTRLEELFPCHQRHYVFLSPTGMTPENESDREYWTVESYSTVLEIIEQTIEHSESFANEDVGAFLRQYATTLRRNRIVSDANTELQQLVREIYLEHREAIELINQHKPDLRGEVQQIIKEVVAEQDGWKLDRAETGFVYFRSLETVDLETMAPGWGHSTYPLLCIEFRCLPEGRAYFRIEIAPETEKNRAVRENLLNGFNQFPRIFSYVPARGAGWITIHEGDYIVSDADLNDWYKHSVRAKIEAWVKDFAENGFPAMNEVIVNCLREYEAETKGQ